MLNDKFFETMGISDEDKRAGGVCPNYYLPLTETNAKKVAELSFVKSLTIDEEPADSLGLSVYPFSPDCPWSRDNYGPLWIPAKGATIELNPVNALIYERVITAYEGHTLDVVNGKAMVDGVQAETYTFQMDYFFMMGDNRDMSEDSRFLNEVGYIHKRDLIGKAKIIFFSHNNSVNILEFWKYLKPIRYERLLKKIK